MVDRVRARAIMIAQDTILRLRYKIIKQIGKGGIGETYLAEDLDMPIEPKPLCVVKRLQPRSRHPHIVKMFQQEAEKLYKLGNTHAQIPTLFAYFQENDEFYLVQELIEGGDLSQEIAPENIWSEDKVMALLQEILPVLKYIHQNNLIHRDIKPHNIMRRSHNNQLVLIDFGIVKEVSNTQINTYGQSVPTLVAGTPGYMPSEQALGKPKFSSDIYALGMTAIQAMTGVKPENIEDDETGEMNWRQHTKVSDALAEVLTKMTRYHFTQRYADAGEALEALNKLDGVTFPETKVYVDFKTHSSVSFARTNKGTSLRQATVAISSGGFPKRLKIGAKYGYINNNGQILIEPRFENAYKFAEGLAAVKILNKWGFIDTAGEMVIDPKFDDVWEFSEGLVRVKIGSYWGYSDYKGKLIIEPNYKETWRFSQGLTSVKIGTRWGYINSTGNLVIKPNFDGTWWFTQNLSRVRVGQKWGYIDLKGELAIPLVFDYAWEFSEGLACVKVGDHYGYINSKAEIVIPPQYEAGTSFFEGLAAVKIGQKWGYIDNQGKIFIQPEYSNTRKFSEGLAAVCLGNKWGYIDTTGDLVINPQFDDTWWFSDQVSRVIIGGRESYINNKGKLIR